MSIKKYILALSIMFFCLINNEISKAEGDLEKALKFGANAVSGGTWLADIEAEKARIRAEGQLAIERMKQDINNQNKEYLKRLLQDSISSNQQRLARFRSIKVKASKAVDSWKLVRSDVAGVIRAWRQVNVTIEDLNRHADRLTETQKGMLNLMNGSTNSLSASYESKINNILGIFKRMVESLRNTGAVTPSRLENFFEGLVNESVQAQSILENIDTTIDVIEENIRGAEMRLSGL